MTNMLFSRADKNLTKKWVYSAVQNIVDDEHAVFKS
jgi:hypothetical protein